MTRQYPPEIYVGQTVDVHVDPSSSPIESRVTYLDYNKGVVHVEPIGYATKWAARPRAITMQGLYLRFENNDFFFSSVPTD